MAVVLDKSKNSRQTWHQNCTQKLSYSTFLQIIHLPNFLNPVTTSCLTSRRIQLTLVTKVTTTHQR